MYVLRRYVCLFVCVYQRALFLINGLTLQKGWLTHPSLPKADWTSPPSTKGRLNLSPLYQRQTEPPLYQRQTEPLPPLPKADWTPPPLYQRQTEPLPPLPKADWTPASTKDRLNPPSTKGRLNLPPSTKGRLNLPPSPSTKGRLNHHPPHLYQRQTEPPPPSPSTKTKCISPLKLTWRLLIYQNDGFSQ